MNEIRKRAMNQDFSWKNSASECIKVYESLMKKNKRG